MPCYLNAPGCPPGSRFNYASKGKDALPGPAARQHADREVRVRDPGRRAAPRRPHAALYGHGLLGGPDQIDEANIRDMSQEHDFAFCATAWSGMAEEDIPNAVKLLGELSGFASFPDRLQQGFVNQLYLGRLLIHPSGLTTDPAFKGLVNPSQLYYDGNSQGGILGTALTAIAPDFKRAVLGVPGINFSVLLTRSSNWDTYGAVFNPGYPRQADRPLVLALINQLWDRGEGDGWAHHVTTDPPAGTPPHRVLMHAAVGDFQVTTYQADVLARTVGARVHKPAFLPGRSLERVPTFGIPAITQTRSRARRSSTGTTGRCGRTARPATGRRRWRTRRRARARTRTRRRAALRPRGSRRRSSCSPATWSTCAAGSPASRTTRRRPRARGRGAGRRRGRRAVSAAATALSARAAARR